MIAEQPISLKEYYAREGAPFGNETARLIGPELDRYQMKTDAEIVNAVKDDKASVIRKHLTWDDRIAGHRYRCLEVQHMRRSVWVRVTTPAGIIQEAPAFLRVSARVVDPKDERLDGSGRAAKVGVSFEVAQANDDIRADVMRRVRMELASIRLKCKRYEALFSGSAWENLFQSIDAILEQPETEEEQAA